MAYRLTTAPELVSALGSDPSHSPRWPELEHMAADCASVVSFAHTYVSSLQAQASGGLTEEALSCVQREMTRFSNDEFQQIISAGLNPGTSDPGIGAKIFGVLDSCGVDRSKLAPIFPPG